MNAARIAGIVAKTNALHPDLVLLPGDFRAEDNRFQTPLAFDDLTRELSRLKARHGIFASLGNHDWWDDPSTQPHGEGPCETVSQLADIGIRTLSNEGLAIAGINLCGIDSQTALWRHRGKHLGLEDVDAALAASVPDIPTVLMAHEPDIWPDLPDAVDVTISGHTHAGQVTVFGKRPVAPSRRSAQLAYGHHHEKLKHLIVSAGLGCSKAPLRFGVTPEIVEITLSPDPATT